MDNIFSELTLKQMFALESFVATKTELESTEAVETVKLSGSVWVNDRNDGMIFAFSKTLTEGSKRHVELPIMLLLIVNTQKTILFVDFHVLQ